MSGHDQEIAEAFKGILSDACLREFPELEVFMCFGCNPDQPKFVDLSDPSNKKIRVCKSFAKVLFDKDRTQYDACGLKVSASSGFILPSFHYKDSEDFLNAFKPPLFNGFTVEIVSDGDDCFTSGVGKLMLSFGAVAMVIGSTLLNLL